MAGGPAQKCQVSARGSRSSAPGCARGAAAGALGPARAAQRQPLLQSPLQVWQCGFTLYAPPPPPRPRSSSSAAAFLPPARSGPPAARPSSPLPRPAARESRGAASVPRPVRGRTEWGAAGRRRALDRSAAPLLLPGSEAAGRRGPLAGSLAPSAALTHVLLTEQNPNYSPAPPPTSATLSHWAAGLFRRNNKTCQSGEGQRVTETRLGGRGARRATERAGPGKAGGRGRGTRRDLGDAGDAASERVPRLGTTPACPARGDPWSPPP